MTWSAWTRQRRSEYRHTTVQESWGDTPARNCFENDTNKNTWILRAVAVTQPDRSRHMLPNSLGLLLCVFSMSCSLIFPSMDWDQVTQLIESEFPDVPVITLEEVSRYMSEGREVVFIDVRHPVEFAVSHLPGAQSQTDNEGFKTAVINAGPDALVVSYCSVGYRSARTLARLRRDMTLRNVENVYSLEGSIFAWANKGLPVYRGDTEVKEVHPYDSTWGSLLNRDLWSYTPSTPALP